MIEIVLSVVAAAWGAWLVTFQLKGQRRRWLWIAIILLVAVGAMALEGPLPEQGPPL